MAEDKAHEEYALRLAAERNREGKVPLTADERLTLLTQIRDGCLYWAAECLVSGKQKGSNAAIELHKFSQDEIIRLENEAHAGAMTRVPWIYTDYPLDGMGPEASDTVN